MKSSTSLKSLKSLPISIPGLSSTVGETPSCLSFVYHIQMQIREKSVLSQAYIAHLHWENDWPWKDQVLAPYD